MNEERRDHVIRSLAVTAKRRGALRFFAVTLHGVASKNLSHIADVGRNGLRGHSSRDDGFTPTTRPEARSVTPRQSTTVNGLGQ